MPFLPVKLGRIAVTQLSPSLPLGKKKDNQIALKQRHVQTTKDGQHWFIAGKTGMGKTKFIKELIKHIRQLHPEIGVYNIDTKKRGDFTASDGTMIVSDVAPDAFKIHGQKMVWQPLRDDIKEYNKFFRNILDAGLPCIVNIDETANMKFGDKPPRELDLLLLQGRAAGIHVIGGTQRVAQSPRELLSQATYVVCFNLTNRYDQNRMIDALELDQRTLGLKKYQFYFKNVDGEKDVKKYNSYEQLLPSIQ